MTHGSPLPRRLIRFFHFVLVFGLSGSALAQESASVTIEQLEEALARRDAVIIELLNRVRALEESGAAPERDIRDPGAQTAQPLAVTDADTGAGAETRASGDFEIDLLAAQRALERGLVQQGARLLDPGQIELDSTFTLSRSQGMFPVALMASNANVVGEISRTFEISERRVDLRVGLPWNTQLEIGLPYLELDQQIETGINGAVQSTMQLQGSGFGDATIGLSKLLAVEKGSRPSLVGRVLRLTGSGDEQDGMVALGGGRSGLSARLSASWRRDPVVFLLSGGYTRYDDNPLLTPGDSFDISLGLGLAVSPETALVLSLNQTLADEFRRDGIDVLGTDRLSSTLDITASTTLGRRVFLRGYTSVGLTDESPDYRFGISLSSRFAPR